MRRYPKIQFNKKITKRYNEKIPHDKKEECKRNVENPTKSCLKTTKRLTIKILKSENVQLSYKKILPPTGVISFAW